MKQIYEIKWTVPLTFCPRQGHNFVIDLGAIREVSRFSPIFEVYMDVKKKRVSATNYSDVLGGFN